MDHTPGNEIEDILEQARIVKKLTPIEYAKARGMSPQLVYYHIRTGKVELEYCQCGRRVIDVEAADEAIQTKAARYGRIVDRWSDQEHESRAGNTGGGEE